MNRLREILAGLIREYGRECVLFIIDFKNKRRAQKFVDALSFVESDLIVSRLPSNISMSVLRPTRRSALVLTLGGKPGNKQMFEIVKLCRTQQLTFEVECVTDKYSKRLESIETRLKQESPELYVLKKWWQFWR